MAKQTTSKNAPAATETNAPAATETNAPAPRRNNNVRFVFESGDFYNGAMTEESLRKRLREVHNISDGEATDIIAEVMKNKTTKFQSATISLA